LGAAKLAVGVVFVTFFAFLAGVQKAGWQALEYLGLAAVLQCAER